MKISREWLLEFVDFSDLSIESFSELITTRVAEIEECYKVGSPLLDAIVAKVIKVEKVPDKDKLSLVTVFTGSETVQVICGAPNVKADSYVCYVPPGGRIRIANKPAEDEELIQVEAKSFGNVLSCGVLLSESELGIGIKHEGIILLEEYISEGLFAKDALKEGTKLQSILPWNDVIIDIDNKSLTHRPDLWSHFGFAREISALLNRPLKYQLDDLADDRENLSNEYKKLLLSGEPSEFSVQIDPETKTRRFAVQHISGLINLTSPLWLQRRLFAVGAGIRNILVDTSNYILHEIGQPNHAYDPSKLSGKVLFSRMAKDGECFKGLDDIERNLTPSDVVIADKESSLALAGIIGGSNFSVSSDTTEILLESANFDPIFVREACKRYQLRTDSSNRFEKNLSPFQVPLGIIRYINILSRSGQNPILSSAWADTFFEPPKPVFISYKPNYIRERLGGVPETDSEILSILSSLGFKLEGEKLEVPYYRATRDISIEDDLVEEVGRTIGYDRVPEVPPKIYSSGSDRTEIGKAEVFLRDFFSANGFTEVYNDNFVSSELYSVAGYDMSDAIELKNPVDQSEAVIRTSLVPQLIEVSKKNQKNFHGFAGFEIGRSYHLLSDKSSISEDLSSGLKNDLADITQERRLLGFFQSFPRKETSSGEPAVNSGIGFYSICTVCERLVEALGAGKCSFEKLESSEKLTFSQDLRHLKFWMHPYRAARILSGDMTVGIISEVRPSFYPSKAERLVICEIDIEALLATRLDSKVFKEIPRYPDSFFEISIVMNKKEEFSNIKNIFLANIGSKLLQSIEPVSVYEGTPLENNEKSLSLKFIFRNESSTIKAEELDALRAKVISVVESSRYKLRS